MNEPIPTKKRRAPLSLRLPPELEEILRSRAALVGMTINAYVRLKIFGYEADRRQKGAPRSIADRQALAKILGLLGATRIFSNANQIAKDINTGCFELSPEVADMVREIRDLVREIRDLLLTALGKRGPHDP